MSEYGKSVFRIYLFHFLLGAFMWAKLSIFNGSTSMEIAHGRAPASKSEYFFEVVCVGYISTIWP